MSDWNDGPPERFERGMEIVLAFGDQTITSLIRDAVDAERIKSYPSGTCLRWRWPGPAQELESPCEAVNRIFDEADTLIALTRIRMEREGETEKSAMAWAQEQIHAQPEHRLERVGSAGPDPERSESVEDAAEGLRALTKSLIQTRCHMGDWDDLAVRLIEAVRADERAKMEAELDRLRAERIQAEAARAEGYLCGCSEMEEKLSAIHKARLREEAEKAWRAGWLSDGDPKQLARHLRDRGLEE